MLQRKGAVETMTVMVLLSLVGTTALLSVGIGGFEDILGMSADSNDANKVQNKIYTPVRNICTQGPGAEDRTRSLTFSNKINVTLISEDRDPSKDQSIRATLVKDSVQLLQTDKISDCRIVFKQSPELYRVFEKDDPYELTFSAGESNGNPAVEISVQQR